MQLAEQLTDYVHAAFTGLWIQTSEADEAEREIVQHARQQGWKLAAWDVAGGLPLLGARLPRLRCSVRPPRDGKGRPAGAVPELRSPAVGSLECPRGRSDRRSGRGN